MKLSQYPKAIAETERSILALDKQIRRIQETVSTLSSAIDREIAFDTSLKNDAQRKAKRDELAAGHKQYQSAIAQLTELQERKADLEIDCRLYRNEFSVLKLQTRDKISRQELQVSDTAA